VLGEWAASGEPHELHEADAATWQSVYRQAAQWLAGLG
jgi:hypothetical protein